MKKLNLSETWVLCLAMWKWIAKEVRKDIGKNVNGLKIEWLEKQGIENVHCECFFCEYNSKRGGKGCHQETGCNLCPAVRVDKSFDCHAEYHYYSYPIAFYKKLLALNKIRLAKKGEKNV